MVSLLGTASFGVYLIHSAVLDTLRGEVLTDKSGSLASVAVFWSATMATTLAIVVVLLKVPYLGWVIGSSRPASSPPPSDRQSPELAAAGGPTDSTRSAR